MTELTELAFLNYPIQFQVISLYSDASIYKIQPKRDKLYWIFFRVVGDEYVELG